MSLTIYLNDPTRTYDTDDYLYRCNITHNLNKMADNAGIYQALWRPEELNAEYAKDIIGLIEKGLNKLKEDPEYFKQFNSPNGWGLYQNFVPFVEDYLNALKKYPDSILDVCR